MMAKFSSLWALGLVLVAGIGRKILFFFLKKTRVYIYLFFLNIVSAQTEPVAANVEVTAEFPDNPFGSTY